MKKYQSKSKADLAKDCKHDAKKPMTHFEKAYLKKLDALIDVLCDIRFVMSGGKD